DVEPREDFIEVMISNYEVYKGLVSCWPYQRFEKLYEHLNFVFNLGAVVILSSLKPEGAYGPCMLISREDYERVGGHEAVKDKIVEDLYFGNLCMKKGLRVSNFLGNGYVKFRMYPGGFRDLFQGFVKNSAKGAISLSLYKLFLIFIWFYGICASFILESLLNTFYLLFSFQFYVITRRLGDYNIYDALLYPVHFLFAFIVIFYSSLRTILFKNVLWKGRKINVH
ncbi:MAG: glycosyltransferase family 2 protein, partial [Dictyoglomus sp.]